MYANAIYNVFWESNRNSQILLEERKSKYQEVEKFRPKVVERARKSNSI